MLMSASLFTGQNKWLLKETGSTNEALKQRLKEEKLPDGSLLIAENQTDGKGQANSKWESEAGKNLTLSYVFYPTFLSPEKQFFLSMAVALGVKDFCEESLSEEIKIKWPNDIYFTDKKLGGILIENSLQTNKIQSSIIGIGLNINQSSFSENLKNPISFYQLKQHEFDLAELIERLNSYLEKYYLQLRAGHYNFLYKAYVSALYLYNQTHDFETKNGRLRGQIIGVNKEGKLIIESNNKEFKFGMKEVSYLK